MTRFHLNKLLPWLVLAAGLAATYFLQQAAFNAARRVQQEDFTYQAREIKLRIEQRLEAYEEILRGFKGLYIASKSVERDEFHGYAGILRLVELYPGIQGVGYSQIISPQEKAGHIEAIRKEVFPGYKIHPEGERDLYTSIVYLEPFTGRNLRAFGYDMYSEAVRRTAMEQARDLDKPVVSGKVRLVQEEEEQDAQAGFLMYLPVYRNGSPHETLADRRANILGWVYAPFRMDDLMLGILGEQVNKIDFEIFDGENATPETLMYDNLHDFGLRNHEMSLYHAIRRIEAIGHAWTIRLGSLPAFEASMDTERVSVIRLTGFLVSALLSLLVWQLASGRARALKLAQDMTRELHRAVEEIRNLAFYDPLTHLPNRRLLLDRLRQALGSSARSGRRGALLFIDLDNFKTLNDTLGHDMGDLLLQQVAQRLGSCVREGDTVARLGGDEFVVMLEGLSEQAHEAAAQTEAVGEKILDTLNQTYQLAAHEYRSTPSIGATLFIGQQQTIEELLKQADITMYQAKKAGRNALRFFDPQMQAAINANATLKSELLKALEQRQLHLYYQVQVDGAHRPLGAEALIRWVHPERGLIPPAQFIALAEESGLMLPIGQWVLETACAQIKSWQQDALTRDLVLAVNVSAKQFRQADFVERVRAAIQRHGINPMLLKLELTEGLLLENIENTIATMTALSEAGVRFSLDDFGTGYSFLQYLKRLPLDQLKIDKLFIRGIATDRSDNAVVHAIIAMAQSLGMDVIAEGVETEEQRQLLLDKGCIHYQGHLFGKPMPIEQFEALLKQGGRLS